MHKASKYIIDYCIEHNLATIIIGHNKKWKQEVNTGKINNQNFVNIPFNNFIQKLQYKAENMGLEVIITEESYSSKVDHLAKEEMKHKERYLGKRIYRGLFKSSTGKIINADVNGAIGILRKVINENEFSRVIDRGVVITPEVVNNQKLLGTRRKLL